MSTSRDSAGAVSAWLCGGIAAGLVLMACNFPVPQSCSADGDCTGANRVCDLSMPDSSVCVQCTPARAEACTGNTPLCGAALTCRGCQRHDECGSNVCLPSGACAAEGEVAYVEGGKNGTLCTKEAPCGTLRAALMVQKDVVKVAMGTAEDNAVAVIDGRAVTILAEPGAKLDRTGDGPILEVKSAGADVKIYDLEVAGASGSSGADGIRLNTGTPKLTLVRVKVADNQGLGIVATGGTLTVTQSTVTNNDDGGLSAMGATFDVTNSFFYANGDIMSAVGGATLAPAPGSASVFSFNTVVNNHIQNSGALAGGVFCDTSGFAPSNNLIARNFVNSDATRPNSNTIGVCQFPSSLIATTVDELKFVSPDNPPYSFRLQAGSSAIDKATTASPVAVDFEGDARPQGAEKDVGADEYKP